MGYLFILIFSLGSLINFFKGRKVIIRVKVNILENIIRMILFIVFMLMVYLYDGNIYSYILIFSIFVYEYSTMFFSGIGEKYIYISDRIFMLMKKYPYEKIINIEIITGYDLILNIKSLHFQYKQHFLLSKKKEIIKFLDDKNIPYKEVK